MNLSDIETKTYILALFIRDDGERFLLGSGAYEFKKDQLHFVANSYYNDVVEVQGNDGVFLAGQVRRPQTQTFEGYIGDASVLKQDVETYRKAFFAFFRKNFYYKVVYIFQDGTAIPEKDKYYAWNEKKRIYCKRTASKRAIPIIPRILCRYEF